MIELRDILEESLVIAEDAARVALSHFRSALLIEMKENMTPVTIADRKTEEFIRKQLERAFPDHGILGEEFGATKKDSDYLWTVDPIDGTRSFIRGIPLFGTLLGLLIRGEPAIGIMVLPALNETYSAARGIGAYCNGHQIHVSSTKAIESALVCCGDLNCFEETGTRAFFDTLHQKSELTRGYSDCFGHSLVLRGAVDAMVDPLVAIWDIAPIACLMNEAGGTYFAFDGTQTFEASSFITCNPNLKRDLLELI